MKRYDLLVAGRCLSASHEAQSSVRIIPICSCLGQAAGIASAMAFYEKNDVQKVDTGLLRKKLRELEAQID